MKVLMPAILFFLSFSVCSSTLKSINALGEKVQVDLTQGTNVIVFINKDCPCVKGHREYFQDLENKYDLKFLYVHSNKKYNREIVQKYYSKKLPLSQIVMDQDLNIANFFRTLKTPHTIVFGDGQILYQGGVTNSRSPKTASKFYLSDVLEDIKNKSKITWSQGKAIGCYIQR